MHYGTGILAGMLHEVFDFHDRVFGPEHRRYIALFDVIPALHEKLAAYPTAILIANSPADAHRPNTIL